MGSIYQHAPQETEPRWRPIVIAGVMIVVVGALIWMLARNAQTTNTQQSAPDPYATNLKVSDMRLSTAQNFVGGTVTYVEGKLTNTGDKTVTAADAITVFRNSLGEVVDRPVQPVRVAAAPLGHPDFVALSTAPLAPGAGREFRLTFEHISADWNQGLPEVRFTKITAK
jgi:hypothetical protein